MPKTNARKNTARRNRGPFLSAAFFCESVIESKDGALTPVRLIDQLTVALDPSTPQDVPSETNRLPIEIWSVIGFKSGDSPGEHVLRLVLESPSGKKQTVFQQMIPLSEPPHGGANIRLKQQIAVMNGGLFWTHVFLDDRPVTSIPLLITIVRGEPKSEEPAKTNGAKGSPAHRKIKKRRA